MEEIKHLVRNVKMVKSGKYAAVSSLSQNILTFYYQRKAMRQLYSIS